MERALTDCCTVMCPLCRAHCSPCVAGSVAEVVPDDATAAIEDGVYGTLVCVVACVSHTVQCACKGGVNACI